ncbi:interleukin-6 receptor subunit beta-like [Antedon mediterranea]|uniref:interleukin-6 receptor subunit beta-like n=1 Tax=Antedon mediterranea TaxID=105859 RepID=UPI003AF9B7D8
MAAVTLPSKPKTFELIEGDVLELRCNLDMTAYTITWYFIETILESNESILGINMSSFDQSGKYSCRVSNDRQEVFITFGRRPVAIKNLTCFETNITHFRCTWLPGDLDTNLPNEYLIYYGRASVPLLNYKKTHNEYIDLAYDHGRMKVQLHVSNALGDHDIAYFAFYSIMMYPPKNVVGRIENDTLLKVNWDPTKYKIEHVYVVSYKEVYPNMKPPEKNEIPCDRSHDDLSEKILDIPTGYKEYEVQVAVRYSREGNINKWSDIVVVMKEETKPPEGTVDGNCKRKDGYDVLTCNWEELPPEKQNGHLLKYKITVFSDDREVDIATTKYNTSLQVEFTGLALYNDYIVNITAHNSVGYTTISSSFVAGQLTASGIGKEYIAVIIIVSIVLIIFIILYAELRRQCRCSLPSTL